MTFGFVPPTFLPVVGFGTPEPLPPALTVEVVIVPVVLEVGSVADAVGVVALMGVLLGVIVFALAFAGGGRPRQQRWQWRRQQHCLEEGG